MHTKFLEGYMRNLSDYWLLQSRGREGGGVYFSSFAFSLQFEFLHEQGLFFK